MTAFAGSLHADRVPQAMSDWIAEHSPGTVWGAVQTGSDSDDGALWFIVTTTRNAIAAVSKKGRTWTDLPLIADATTVAHRTRQLFRVDGRDVFDASRLTSGKLERLFEVAFLPRAKGLHAAAQQHIDAKLWTDATALLTLAERALRDEDRVQSVAYLSLAQRITIDQAACAVRLDAEGEAIVLLGVVSDDRPQDDLLRATSQHHDLDGWLLTLALAHEEASQPQSAASVYATLHAHGGEDVLVLAQARALRRAGLLEEAAAAYAAFLAPHLADEVRLLVSEDQATDVREALIARIEVLERAGAKEAAASACVDLLRSAPLETIAYERLAALDLDDADMVGRVDAVQRVLHGGSAVEAAERPEFKLSPIEDEAHDRWVVHPGERAYAMLAQRWIGALTRDERDTKALELHAQRVDDGSFPQASEMLDAVCAIANIDRPRFYLSHGSAGVEVLGTKEPFILLGACHLDTSDPRHLSPRELAFALGVQVEHIRADHLLLTSSEFWRTFGTKSLTTMLAFVPMGDFVSKLTDSAVLKWVRKLTDGSSGTVRAALELVEKRVAAGVTGEGVQSAYTATLASARSRGLQASTSDESLVKERLADFARAAQYTADRVGLLACDDLSSAVSAMVRLSPTLYAHAPSLPAEGYRGLLEAAADEPAIEELTLRVAELLRFALSDAFVELRRIVYAEREST